MGRNAVTRLSRSAHERLRTIVRSIPRIIDERRNPRQICRELLWHRAPEPLLCGLRVLTKTAPRALKSGRVELVGSREHLLPGDALAGLPAGLVAVRDSVDYIDSLALMRESDLLLVLDATGDRSMFLPSKLVEYLGARRPIVALTPERPAAALARRAGGLHADPSDPTASARVIGEAIATVRRDARSHRPPDEVVEEYAERRSRVAFESWSRPSEQRRPYDGHLIQIVSEVGTQQREQSPPSAAPGSVRGHARGRAPRG